MKSHTNLWPRIVGWMSSGDLIFNSPLMSSGDMLFNCPLGGVPSPPQNKGERPDATDRVPRNGSAPHARPGPTLWRDPPLGHGVSRP